MRYRPYPPHFLEAMVRIEKQIFEETGVAPSLTDEHVKANVPVNMVWVAYEIDGKNRI